MKPYYSDRFDAGRVLATKLIAYAHRQDVLLLALPRGGVAVASEVAKVLHVPLDVCAVRKLGVPGHEELAMGALATGGVRVLNVEIVQMLHIPEQVINAVAEHERQELKRRERLYRDERPPLKVRGRTVILIDDGLATGATMHAAVQALQQQHPARLVVAVPVAAPSVCENFQVAVDEVICVKTPEPFYGVGYWYEHFPQMTDQDVHDLLTQVSYVI
ncbi:MAG: phosphoribosyltransferase [Ktedonobacteraceae bacterium]